jgi:hypothetical protein
VKHRHLTTIKRYGKMINTVPSKDLCYFYKQLSSHMNCTVIHKLMPSTRNFVFVLYTWTDRDFSDDYNTTANLLNYLKSVNLRPTCLTFVNHAVQSICNTVGHASQCHSIIPLTVKLKVKSSQKPPSTGL